MVLVESPKSNRRIKRHWNCTGEDYAEKGIEETRTCWIDEGYPFA